ncbi:putative 2OG-Fe(II) oxygenase [Urbifossiella limnaea]|uniref:Uncharacterized protein n=1 Tax=Urbifossiella limnaea TaxID=2528023 RepID=A0A517XNU7_9BACT|nr:hypothetical protein ETAA1_10600 [Urbifossiella limnaea]
MLFPSLLKHGVEPNRSAADRVCVSFNVGLRAVDPSRGPFGRKSCPCLHWRRGDPEVSLQR